MIPRRLLRQPLSLQKMRVQADEYGSRKLLPDGEPVIVNGFLDFENSSEVLSDRDTVTTSWKALLPAQTDITAYDLLTFEGSTFQVEGAPEHVWNPRRGKVSHVEARLKEVH